MQELIWKYIAVALTCAVKYIFGVIGAISAGFNLVETLVVTVGGGMVGVVVYLYVWDGLVWLYRKIIPRKAIEGIRINNRLRLIVKVIKKYELYGVAFLTPLLLSVPVGVIVASAFEEDKWRIKRYMFFSFLGWSLFLYGIRTLFGIDVQSWFA